MPPQQQPTQEPPQQQPQRQGSKISNTEWGLVIGALGMIDVAQGVLDASAGIGVLINRGIDIVVALALLLYLWLRKYTFDMKTLGSILAAFGFEMIPAVDIAPLWFVDGLYLMAKDKGMNLPI